MDYYDPCITEPSEELRSQAIDLAWKDPGEYTTAILESDDWGKLKKKIQKHREKNHVIAVKGGKEKINRKTVSDPRVDILLHPGKNRKDPGMDKGIVETAVKNNVVLGLDFSRILTDPKQKTHVFTEWRKNLKLCEKYGMGYIITTSADEKHGLRAPKDLESLIKSLNFSGRDALETSAEIVTRNRKKLETENQGGN